MEVSEVKLQVSGMHCHACEMRIQMALEDVVGVHSASASHETGEVVVTAEPDTSRDALVKAIKEEGFVVVG